jgi:isopenicillin N synthase-like dioxygenase
MIGRRHTLKTIFYMSLSCVAFFKPGLASRVSMEELRPNENPLKTFQYTELSARSGDIMSEFKTKGYIAIEGVPGFTNAYQDFLQVAQQFIALSPEEKEKCTPSNFESKGWAYGKEQLYKGLPDSFKGSYYVRVPDRADDPNVWPESLPAFKAKYLALCDIMQETGKIIFPLVSMTYSAHSLGRMLYYGPVTPETNDKNPHWCAVHRDHGGITLLGAEVFFKDGQPIDKPKGSGLYILEEEISCPTHIMLCQIGEWPELLTDGKVNATLHHVKKALNGASRYAFALFMDPDNNQTVQCNNPDVLKKYEDRYKPGIDYTGWNDASLKKYNPKESNSSS